MPVIERFSGFWRNTGMAWFCSPFVSVSLSHDLIWTKIIREYCLKTIRTIPKLCLYQEKFYRFLNSKMSREFLVFFVAL